jgi:class 3 adenylate cyclase
MVYCPVNLHISCSRRLGLALAQDLAAAVATILREVWTERDGTVVPDPEDLQLGNDAINLDATVLYADLADSTSLVDGQVPFRAAEYYKVYMLSAARIIKDWGGSITAYDGDRKWRFSSETARTRQQRESRLQSTGVSST